MFEDFGDGKKKGRGAHNEETGGVGGRRLGAKPDEAVGGEDQREGERFSLSWIRFVTSAHLGRCAVACLSNDNQVRAARPRVPRQGA